MFLFNKEDVYIGYSLEELTKIREILDKESIRYNYKVLNHSGQWLAGGTTRGKFGSYGMDMNYEKQYVVSVNKIDSELAKYLVNRVLHT